MICKIVKCVVAIWLTLLVLQVALGVAVHLWSLWQVQPQEPIVIGSLEGGRYLLTSDGQCWVDTTRWVQP